MEDELVAECMDYRGEDNPESGVCQIQSTQVSFMAMGVQFRCASEV